MIKMDKNVTRYQREHELRNVNKNVNYATSFLNGADLIDRRET